jgi:hypothetical protein
MNLKDRASLFLFLRKTCQRQHSLIGISGKLINGMDTDIDNKNKAIDKLYKL